MLFHSSVWESQRDAFWTRLFVWSSTYLKQAIIDPQKWTGLRSGELFAPRKECWADRQHFRKVKCRCWLSPRQCTVICSQRFDSRCFRGASNVRPWWTHSRQVVLLTVNLVAVCSSVNTQIHATYVDTSERPLLMIYALSLQWLKSKHWQERTANGFVMASRLILLSVCTKSP